MSPLDLPGTPSAIKDWDLAASTSRIEGTESGESSGIASDFVYISVSVSGLEIAAVITTQRIVKSVKSFSIGCGGLFGRLKTRT